MAGEHLYAHFFEAGHDGLSDMAVKVINKTDFNKPFERENFLANNVEYMLLTGLNMVQMASLNSVVDRLVYACWDRSFIGLMNEQTS